MLVRRAIVTLTDKQYCHLYAHYVIPVSAKTKIERMGHSRENYYATLAMCHRKLANAMEYGQDIDKIKGAPILQ